MAKICIKSRVWFYFSGMTLKKSFKKNSGLVYLYLDFICEERILPCLSKFNNCVAKMITAF